MIIHTPNPQDIVCGSRTTSGTILTVPAGGVWTGDISISASVAVAATATPNVTTLGTNAAPAPGTVVQRLSITGLALTTVTDSNTIPVIVRAPSGNDITLEFDTGGATSAAVVANGFVLI